MTTHTTRSGRALPHGRVTRRGLAVGRPRGVRPLPLSMQVRPQVLTPMPRHPGCFTSHPASRAFLAFRDALSSAEYGLGYGLSGNGPATIYVKGCDVEYRHHDVTEALGWAWAANEHGYVVSVYIGGV